MTRLLARSSARYLRRHPWLFILSILGVALGVAVVVAIDVANSSARRAFELSTEAVAGRATHQVRRAEGPLPDTVYRSLKVDLGFRDAAPVVEGFVRSGARTLRVLGIDPLAEAPFRGYTSARSFDLGAFMTEPTTLLSSVQAEVMGLAEGSWIRVDVAGVIDSLRIIGEIEPGDERMRRSLEDLLLVDVSTAQRMFGLRGQLSYIDLLLEDGDQDAVLDRIEAQLPAGIVVQRSEARTRTVEQMTRAFELNLSALSLLALVVGMFLIYNTMTFSVVQRRGMIGRLRAIGVTRREITWSVLGEAALIAVLGTALGFGLGIVLADRLVGLVAQTINDLYFVVNVTGLALEPWTVVKGASLGIGATIFAALWPAREAARTPATIVMQRSAEESSTLRRAPFLAALGVAVGFGGGAILILSGQSIELSYVGMLGLILGSVLLVPVMVIGYTRVIRGPAGALLGLTGRMAARGLTTSLSRIAVAIAALTVAIAATIGVGVMVDSFRETVDVWLTQTLRADVYIQPPSLLGRGGDGTLRPEVIERIRSIEGIEQSHTVRSRQFTLGGRPFNLTAIDAGAREGSGYRFKDADVDRAWEAFRSGDAIIISEPFSFRFSVSTGDSLEIPTDDGSPRLPIAGVYYDYGSDLGVVLMNRTLYERLFEDRERSGISLVAAPGQDVDALMDRVREETAGMQELLIRSNRGLREASLDVFDRTFQITGVLRILTILVAFVGVLSAFMSLQLEKVKEIAVMRAQGFTPRQVGGYVTAQSVLGGLLSGLLAVPLGLLLAVVLVYVINKRSFGWTLQFIIPLDILVQAVLLAVVAAFMAALYPAWRMASTNPALALRNE